LPGEPGLPAGRKYLHVFGLTDSSSPDRKQETGHAERCCGRPNEILSIAQYGVLFVVSPGLLAAAEGLALFPNTHWSVVLAARHGNAPQAAAALETICGSYWQPLYAYARRSVRSPHDAEDITQEFFRRLIEKGWLESVDRDKGKLRTFLIVALKHFMSKEWRRAASHKRGGGQSHVQLDTALAESRFAADPGSLTAEDAFDQQWALTVFDLTLTKLQAEHAASGKPEDFEAFKSCLVSRRGAIVYSEIADRLGMSEGAVRVAVHRFRKRFRELYREQVAQTLSQGADLEEELRHLAGALARRSGAGL
jgi:RNA polymerase sigma factor (sigma-70 family)